MANVKPFVLSKQYSLHCEVDLRRYLYLVKIADSTLILELYFIFYICTSTILLIGEVLIEEHENKT